MLAIPFSDIFSILLWGALFRALGVGLLSSAPTPHASPQPETGKWNLKTGKFFVEPENSINRDLKPENGILKSENSLFNRKTHEQGFETGKWNLETRKTHEQGFETGKWNLKTGNL